MDGRFTEEELALAKSVDLCAVAESLGYTVKRIGKYHTLKEMDSIRIYNRSHWYRWSRQFDKGNNGGSQIDFLRVFCGMTVKDAVFWLLDFAGYRRIESPAKQPLVHQVTHKTVEERKPFILPEQAGDNSYLISYLNHERGISRAVIDIFLKAGLIYESRNYHNVVFKGNDKDGVTRFASMRGVFDRQGKPFKCDVAGNDKNYGFNVVNADSTELVVFEAAIDLKPVRNPEREKPKWEDTITNRMLHWSYTAEQKEELKMALAAGVPRVTILTYFYPEVTVEKMSSYRMKQ